MEILPLQPEHLDQAAAMFVERFKALRAAIPTLPDQMEDPAHVCTRLARLLTRGSGMVAFEEGRMVGYLSAFMVEAFRGTSRKGAYCPEWGHTADAGRQAEIYRALYRASSARWAEAGCQVHAISLLANNRAAIDTWFWNGFGLVVVDGIRPAQPVGSSLTTHLQVRRAGPGDVPAICELDAEHCRHYTQPPVFMAPVHLRSEAENLEFLQVAGSALWMGWDGSRPAGFMRFDARDFDSVDILKGEGGVKINGAYIRPEYRRHGLSKALLNAALSDYQARGMKYCAVNFESFNPEAAALWPRYFELAAYSVLRVPEVA